MKGLKRDEHWNVDLSGLTDVSPRTIQILNQKAWLGNENRWTTLDLNLNGLKAMTPDLARALASRSEGMPSYMGAASISLNGLTTIDAECGAALSRYAGKLELEGLTKLSDDVAGVLLARSGDLNLNGLKSLSNPAISALQQFSGDTLELNGIEEISLQGVDVVFKEDRETELQGLTKLTAEVAKAIIERKRYWLSFDKLESLDEDVAEVFSSMTGLDEDGDVVEFTLAFATLFPDQREPHTP